MKKIDFTNPGGIDWTGNDLQFVYTALREALEASLSYIKTYNNVIMSGCVITEDGGNYTYTEGWVWHDAKLYFVPALTTPNPISLTNYIWTFIEDEVIAEGTQTCEDLTTANTWKICKAQIARSAGATNLYSAINNYGEVLKQVIPEEGWQTPTFDHSWGGTFKFKKNRWGEIEFIGAASHATLAPGQENICSLPVAYRPVEDKWYKVAGSDGSGGDSLLVKVLTTGMVIITTATYGVTKNLYLHSIRFRLS